MTARDALILGIGLGSCGPLLALFAARVLHHHAVRRYDARLAASR